MDIVARPMVVVVQAGVKHHRRHAGGDEGKVVGVLFDVPDEGEFQA